jgi:hypothetical protein
MNGAPPNGAAGCPDTFAGSWPGSAIMVFAIAAPASDGGDMGGAAGGAAAGAPAAPSSAPHRRQNLCWSWFSLPQRVQMITSVLPFAFAPPAHA